MTDHGLIGPPMLVSGDLPLTIAPQTPPTPEWDPAAWVTANEAALVALLERHGAVHLRGLVRPRADDFSRVVSAFARWADLPYEDSLSYAVRLPVCARVCTTNEAKLGGMTFHHEQAAAPRYPSKLFFFCERPATSGGATGVSPSWRVLEALEAAFPAFVAEAEAKGARYSARLPAQDDPSKGVGRSWRSFFTVRTRAEAEARLAHYGYAWAWDGDGEDAALSMTTGALPAVRSVPGPRGAATRVFFNQMAAQAIANAAEFAAPAGGGAGGGGSAGADAEFAGPFLTFGDGSPVPMAPLRFAHRVAEAESVELEWAAGDVALLDNALVMHARRAFEGPRRVLASLATG